MDWSVDWGPHTVWLIGQVIKQMGPAGAPAVPLLVTNIWEENDDDVQRWTSIYVLGEMGTTAGDIVPLLIQVLRKRGYDLEQGEARSILEKMPARAVPLVVAALEQDKEPHAQKSLLWFLKDAGPAAAPAKPMLRKLLTADDKEVRDDASELLRSLDRSERHR